MKNYKIWNILLIISCIMSQTPEQIKKAKEIIKQTGMTESQARSMAKAQGYSDKQIDAAIEKELGKSKRLDEPIKDESKKSGIPDLGVTNNMSNQKTPEIETKNIVEEEMEILDDDEEVNEINESKQQKPSPTFPHFGYDIFRGDPSLFQATSVGAVDPEYLIGPGDEIIVMLWGETQFRQVLTVDREGFIFIPEVGQVFVNGLNLNLLESKLFRVLSQAYASLNPQNRKATTFLDVSLGNLRPLRIQVLGEVNQPGAYTVSPSATLFSALYYFNGPTILGSLRDIQLIRNDKHITSIDFYDYLLTGKRPNDEKLQLDDVIFIPKRMKTVSISGEIQSPGVYELKSIETLKDLIEISGKLKITAYLDRIQIDRIIPFERRLELGIDRMFVDVNLRSLLESDEKFELFDGDAVNIFSILDIRSNVVEISGSVTRPGKYDLGDSLTLLDLINKADGILGSAYLDRIDVVRVKPDDNEELIKLNLEKVLNGETESNIKLKGLDKIRVYGIEDLVSKSYVSIEGFVKRPGEFLLQENMTLYDLIFMGGGIIDEKNIKDTYLERAELIRQSVSSFNKKIIPFNLGLVLEGKGEALLPLKGGDAVRIYSISEIKGQTRYVNLSGHVKREGSYELYNNMTVFDLLFKAGGFDDLAFQSTTYLDRADLIRYGPKYINKFIIPFNLDSVLSNKSSKQNFKLFNGDEIRIYSSDIFEKPTFITISGSINNPGTYQLKNGMTIKDIIFESGGVSDNVYKYKIEIARIDPNIVNDDAYAETINLDMLNDYSISNIDYKLGNNSSKIEIKRDEFKLRPYDHIMVRPDPHFHMQRMVNLSGAVYYPGDYVIKQSKETVSDLMKRAEGLRPNAYPIASTLTRKGQMIQIDMEQILKKPYTKFDITLQDGDLIFVATQPTITQILGEVSVPGFYKYVQGQRVNDYIKTAGGFTQNAEKKDIWIRYPNGKSQQYNRWFSNPKVLDGSIITIGLKKEEEPFDKTEFTKEIASIMADFAQVVMLIAAVNQSN